MNRNGRLAILSLTIVATALLCAVGSVAAQGTVITLADGVVVPGGGGFVDLDPVDVDGYQQVALLGFATPDPLSDVAIFIAFATDSLPYGAATPKVLAAQCGIADSGVHGCGSNSQAGFFFPVAGQFLTVRLATVSADAPARTVTLKAYLK